MASPRVGSSAGLLKEAFVVNRMTKTKHLAVARLMADLCEAILADARLGDLVALYGDADALVHLLQAVRLYHQRAAE